MKPIVQHSCLSLSPALALLAAMCLPGCAGREATVSGTVTLDGDVLDQGTVTFTPAGGGAVAYGQIAPGGRYSVKTGRGKGLAAGSYIVTVVATTTPSPDDDELEQGAGGVLVEKTGEMLTPEQYASKETSPLRAEIKPGGNRVDLELKSEPE